MAPLKGRKNEEGDRSASMPLFTNKNNKKDSHFYKIIVAPSTQSQKITIPQDYVKKYGRRQLKTGYIKLRVADGKLWRIELSKGSGNVCLTEGWEMFYKSYAIDYGYFLLFKYDNGEFNVTIFDLTSCQIEYDQVFHNYMETLPEYELSSQVDEMDLSDYSGDLITPDDDLAVEDEIRVNKSPNPRFQVVMSLNNISNRYEMTFPYTHVRTHLKPDEKHQDLIWTTSDGERYIVRLNVIMKRCIARLNNCQWRRFVQENVLQRGDTCAFELVKPETNGYKVTIFRANKYNNYPI